MVGGVNGPTGQLVPRLVVMEQNQDTGTVTILYHNTGGSIALGILVKVNVVLGNLVL